MTGGRMVHPECDFCHELASYHLTAQWTLFNWDHRYTCVGHLSRGQQELSRRVDGEPPWELLSMKLGG